MGYKKYIIAFGILPLLALASTVAAQAPPGNELIIEVNGFDSMKGQLVICLSNSTDDFMNDCFLYKVVEVNDTSLEVSFSNIPLGNYAICLFHDQDLNGKLNKSFFGFPSESYGFSNNPACTFGPPDFEKCSFAVDGMTKLEIKL